jgi:hypothetical protein
MLGSHKSAAREIPTADTLQLPDRPSPIAYWLLAIGYWLLAIRAVLRTFSSFLLLLQKCLDGLLLPAPALAGANAPREI